MKEGYFYFIPVSDGKREPDKSLGYLSVSKAPARHAYSVQCSLNQNTLKARSMPELYLSSAVYADSESVLIGKMHASGGSRLFMDTYISASSADSFNENLYAVVSSGGRTLCYSIIHEPSSASDNAQDIKTTHTQHAPQPASKPSAFAGTPFDPFETTNPSYKWFIYDSRETVPASVRNMQDLDKLLKYYNINYGMFTRLGGGTGNGTFLKMAHYAMQFAGHLLRGEYTAPETGRHFTIIGLPGWNAQAQQGRYTRGGKYPNNNQNSSAAVRTIRECARWIAAKQKPQCAYNRSYNGYWLYYFDAESGLPVKAVMKE